MRSIAIPFEFPTNVKLPPDDKVYYEGPIIQSLEDELFKKSLSLLFQRPSIRWNEGTPFKGVIGQIVGFGIDKEKRIMLYCDCFDRPLAVLEGWGVKLKEEQTTLSVRLCGHWKFNDDQQLEKVDVKSGVLLVENLDEIVKRMGGSI